MKVKYLATLFGLVLLLAAACGSDDGSSPGGAAGGEPIKIGIIADLSGPFTTYGTSLANSATLAINEINEDGGIAWRQIEVIVEDIQTDVSITVDKARKLTESDNVDLVIGPIGSDANDAAFQAVAVDAARLLFYPETYEGGKCHVNFFSFGAVPAQQVRPLIPILQDEYGPNVMLFGADYVWPQRTFEIAKPIIAENGGTVVSELYLPLVADDFTEFVTAVRDTEPDYILSLYPAVWGPALKALDDAGLLTDDLGIGTTFLGDPDLPGVGELAAGDYTALPFFTAVAGEAAQEYLADYTAAFGGIPSGGEGVGAYNAVYMYKAAVEAAGSTDPAAVSSALVGLSFDGPTGSVTMDDSHHLRQTINLVKANDAGEYEFVTSFADQDPEESTCS